MTLMEPVEKKTHYLLLEARGLVRVLAGILAIMGSFGFVVMVAADIPKSLYFYITLAIGAIGAVVMGLVALKGRVLIPYKREENRPGG